MTAFSEVIRELHTLFDTDYIHLPTVQSLIESAIEQAPSIPGLGRLLNQLRVETLDEDFDVPHILILLDEMELLVSEALG